jgi:hypothetical protein
MRQARRRRAPIENAPQVEYLDRAIRAVRALLLVPDLRVVLVAVALRLVDLGLVEVEVEVGRYVRPRCKFHSLFSFARLLKVAGRRTGRTPPAHLERRAAAAAPVSTPRAASSLYAALSGEEREAR